MKELADWYFNVFQCNCNLRGGESELIAVRSTVRDVLGVDDAVLGGVVDGDEVGMAVA